MSSPYTKTTLTLLTMGGKKNDTLKSVLLELLLQNTAVGRSVFMVNATDPDQGTGGSVLFSFQPPSPFFSIDGARGTVTVIRPLDYETTSAYQLTVNATVSARISGGDELC